MISITDPNNNLILTDAVVASNSGWRWVLPSIALIALLALFIFGDNVAVFYWMNKLTSYADDGLWRHLSLIGDGQIVILFVLPFLGRRPDVVWQYLLATILGGLFVPGTKELFSSLRPPASLLEGSFHLIGPALQSNAFPSGHTTAMFVLAGLVCLQRVNVGLKVTMILLAFLVGLSRIASGIHWPLDILGAALGGWLVAIVAVWISQQWSAGLNIWVQRIFALIVTPFSVWAVWSLWQHHDNVYPGTGLLKVVLLLTCLVLSIPGLLRLFDLKK